MLRPAVPAAVPKRLGEQALDDAADINAEVCARGHRPAVDARLGPLPVDIAQCRQSSAPSLGGDPRPLGGDEVIGRVDQIAQHLPTDGRVAIEEPLVDARRASRDRLPDSDVAERNDRPTLRGKDRQSRSAIDLSRSRVESNP